MKNLIKTLSAVLLVTAINACTLQEAPDSTTQGAITITAQTVQEQGATNIPGTKTTIVPVTTEDVLVFETHWEAGEDAIGIFSPQAKATSDGTPEANPAKNLAFTAQNSAKSSAFAGTMFWGTGNHDFYAYYPRNSGFSGERTAVPVSLPWAQTQSAAGNTAHIGALDFMVATPLTVTPTGEVNFTFNHVFSMIEFQIVGSGTLTQVSLSGAYPLACEGTIDLTQDPDINFYNITTSGTTNNVTVTLDTPVVLDPAEPVSVYMMVLPGIQDTIMRISVTTEGIWKEMEKRTLGVLHGFTRGLIEPGFARGNKYVVSLNTADDVWENEFTDSRDANDYSYRLIGTQVWMTENLAYLPSVNNLATGSEDTHYETVPFYYVYGYDGTDVDEDGDVDVEDAKATSNYATYGVLYNWNAALTACPTGWHLPSDAEWKQLEMYLGMSEAEANATECRGYMGGKLKEEGTEHWNSPNSSATNESGFTGLPGGLRDCMVTYHDGYYVGENVSFASMNNYGLWWTSTQYDENNAWQRDLGYYDSGVRRYGENSSKFSGLSVRCVRD